MPLFAMQYYNALKLSGSGKIEAIGEVAEWLNAQVSKTCIPLTRDRGFKSLPLRRRSSVAPRPIYYARLALCGLLKKSRKPSESQKYPGDCKIAKNTLKVKLFGSKLFVKIAFLAIKINHFCSYLVYFSVWKICC